MGGGSQGLHRAGAVREGDAEYLCGKPAFANTAYYNEPIGPGDSMMGKSSTRTTYQAAAENELPSIYSHAGVAFRGHMRTNFIGNGGAPVRPVNDRHQPFGFFTTQYKSNPAASENTSMVDTSNPTKPSWDHSVFYWPTKLTDLPATRFFDGAAAQDSVTATAPPGTLNSVRMPGNPIKSQQRLSQGGNAGAGQQRPIDGITKGTRVVLKDQRTGMVKWVGLPDTRYVTKEPLLGVHLDDPVGKHDGMLNGKRYFTTPPNHAVFVKKRDVLMVIAPKSMTPHHYARVNPERDTRLKGTKNADAAPTSIMDKLAQKMAQDASGEPATIAASKAEAEMRARREKLRQKLNVAQSLGEQLKVEDETKKRYKKK